jgi:choline kinase
LLLAYHDTQEAPYGEEEMKVKVRCGRVTSISKTMDPDEADGENLGIVKFGPEGARMLVDIMDRLIDAGELRAWAPRAFHEFAQTRPLHAIGTRGLPWIEIDFPEDYQRAVTTVLPQIEGDAGAVPSVTRSVTHDPVNLSVSPDFSPAADAVRGQAIAAGDLR